MKTIYPTFLTCIFVFFFSWIQPNWIPTEIPAYLIDSLRQEFELKSMLMMAQKNIDKDSFSINDQSDNTENPTNFDLQYGNHFTSSIKHLIVRRSDPGMFYFDIFAVSRGQFVKVASHQNSALTYQNDTIQDINGDGLKDFVVNWYGSSGCCLKAFSEVFLIQADKKTFGKQLQFINPTFSPIEKMVRGVCYGFPGETELYKYHFEGNRIDTIEYVAIERNKEHQKTGDILITNNRLHMDNVKILKRLKNVPQEYKKIEGYDWFLGD